MTEPEALFLQLSEECVEVSHRVSKLLRFGAGEIEEGNTVETNLERLRYEINDMLAVLKILEDRKLVVPANAFTFQRHCDAKEAKVNKYMRYSKELGIIT